MSNPLLLSSLSKFFKENPKEAQLLQSLVNGTYPVSLRVMDWFITHYSKQKNVLYWIDDHTHTYQETVPTTIHSGIRKFHLYYEYRAQLKSYTKLCFDPFRRHDRISFVIDPEGLNQKPVARAREPVENTKAVARAREPVENTKPVSVETTVGQLNFFRWAIQNHILEYIENHRVDIEESMIAYQNQRRKRNSMKTNEETNEPKPKGKIVAPKKKPVESIKREYNIRFD